MNQESIPLWLALIVQLGLGLAVFRANYRSYANQAFLLVSVCISAWLICLQYAFNAGTSGAAESWIRSASVAGVLMANSFNVLRLGIVCRDAGWREIAKRAALLLAPSVALAALFYTPLSIRYAELQRESPGSHEFIPRAVYGPLPPIYVIAALAAINVAFYIRDARRVPPAVGRLDRRSGGVPAGVRDDSADVLP